MTDLIHGNTDELARASATWTAREWLWALPQPVLGAQLY